MKRVQVTVNGKKRSVYVEKALTANSWRARTYVGSSVVSGTLWVNKLGVYRFVASGVNARLLAS
jgi:hypothetical protein